MPKSKKKSSSINPGIIFQYFGLAFLTMIAGGIVTFNMHSLISSPKVLAASSQTVEESSTSQLEIEKEFWLDIVEKAPTYRDGYIELWDIENKLGNKLSALEYINQAKKIDPNSKVIPLLELQNQ